MKGKSQSRDPDKQPLDILLESTVGMSDMEYSILLTYQQYLVPTLGLAISAGLGAIQGL